MTRKYLDIIQPNSTEMRGCRGEGTGTTPECICGMREDLLVKEVP